MQSLSIEIGPNKRAYHPNNATLFPSDTFAPSHFPNTSALHYRSMTSQSAVSMQGRAPDHAQFPVPSDRSYGRQDAYSRRYCDQLDTFDYPHRKTLKRNRQFFDSANAFDKIYNDCYNVDALTKRIKSEMPSNPPDCSRLLVDTHDSSSCYESQTLQFHGSASEMDDSLDLLSSPFDTDFYTSMIQRLDSAASVGDMNKGSSATFSPDQNSQLANNTSVQTSAELKSSNRFSDNGRQKAGIATDRSQCSVQQQSYQDSGITRGDNSVTNDNASHYANPNCFPLYSQCMMADVTNPSCTYDFDQRFSGQSPLSSASNFCNHSINITLRYK
ncbi:hypothetical protein DPMN_137701 [Dreissena polymorpha]|uniref:Uncharacterized protein n=1 Tax=Dreissena polymorpha TaxID=45954 RepID=A0A9D4G5Y9_DREPO|nr:hypothetical protein DPMN_137701 [Dreissena polymorpha]